LDLRLKRKSEMSALTSIEVRTERLLSEIAQLEARYDGVFPPGIYAVLVSLRRELAELDKS
jgi:hypothetical protein